MRFFLFLLLRVEMEASRAINEKGKIEINLKGGKLILINDGKKIDIIKPDNYQIEYLK